MPSLRSPLIFRCFSSATAPLALATALTLSTCSWAQSSTSASAVADSAPVLFKPLPEATMAASGPPPEPPLASVPEAPPREPLDAATAPLIPADAPTWGRGSPRDSVVREAREAFARHDRARLFALRGQALAQRHPLAPWIDYWELTQRLPEVSAAEIGAFYARWPASYVEDRLRNDWLIELGRRRDWVTFSRDFPRFRMNDDREVTCYATLADYLAGKSVREAARTAWLAQRDVDEGCQLMAQTLFEGKVFTEDDIWRRLRQATEYGRQRAARAAAQMLSPTLLRDLDEAWDSPLRFLNRNRDIAGSRRTEIASIALARTAASDPATAALQMSERWDNALNRDTAAWTWALIAKQGAQSLQAEAPDWAERAWAAAKPYKGAAPEKPEWGDDILAWHARAALRAGVGAKRWRDLLRATDAMSPAERNSETWAYWRARAQLALAKDKPETEPARSQARAALNTLSNSVSFYGLLAAEELAVAFTLPAQPVPLSTLERAGARNNPGLQRAIALINLNLRDEGRREWNFTLRGMSDRELLAAAQWACDVGDWQLCINTSERTKTEIDLQQRYPMPFQRDIANAAQLAGLEPAFVFGLIRQETRFMSQLRSAVGAAGLMQLMPATAKWTAKKVGIDFRLDQITDLPVNLRLGTSYLKMVLDNFGGSTPMAAAAYNAGPTRSRRWRGGLMLEPAIWTENVPFLETRDYVKKVTTNAAIYAGLQSGKPPVLRPRLGPEIGPRDAERPPAPDMP